MHQDLGKEGIKDKYRNTRVELLQLLGEGHGKASLSTSTFTAPTKLKSGSNVAHLSWLSRIEWAKPLCHMKNRYYSHKGSCGPDKTCHTESEKRKSISGKRNF